MKDFKLHINLIKKIPETFIFRDESLYNCLYEFCQFIATEYSDDQYIVNSCEHLKKECLAKKELNIETIKYFIHFLNSNYRNSPFCNVYSKGAANILEYGILSCPINVSFNFQLLSGASFIPGPLYLDACNCLRNTFFGNEGFNSNAFFIYIEETFNDDAEKTKVIISACKELLLKHSFKIDIQHPSMANMSDNHINFSIQGMSNEPIIPLNLVQFEYLKAKFE